MCAFFNHFGGQADKDNMAARQRQDVTVPDEQQTSSGEAEQ